MRIHNLYTDANGQSHFRDIEVEWAEERRGSKMSKRLPASGIIFRETQAAHDIDWHPAPRRQYIINLDAGVKITASDGESRLIGTGEVILVEDTTGKGHPLPARRRQNPPFDLRAGRIVFAASLERRKFSGTRGNKRTHLGMLYPTAQNRFART
jgi:hypothetical protein